MILNLLGSKNRCLKKYLSLSKDFLVEIQKGEFSGLEKFYGRRDATLKAMELYDRKISDTIALLPSVEKTTELSQRVNTLLQEKDGTIYQILAVDDQIISVIEGEKSRIQKELRLAQKAKEQVKKFKSSWMTESGDELDQKL